MSTSAVFSVRLSSATINDSPVMVGTVDINVGGSYDQSSGLLQIHLLMPNNVTIKTLKLIHLQFNRYQMQFTVFNFPAGNPPNLVPAHSKLSSPHLLVHLGPVRLWFTETLPNIFPFVRIEPQPPVHMESRIMSVRPPLLTTIFMLVYRILGFFLEIHIEQMILTDRITNVHSNVYFVNVHHDVFCK